MPALIGLFHQVRGVLEVGVVGSREIARLVECASGPAVRVGRDRAKPMLDQFDEHGVETLLLPVFEVAVDLILSGLNESDPNRHLRPQGRALRSDRPKTGHSLRLSVARPARRPGRGKRKLRLPGCRRELLPAVRDDVSWKPPGKHVTGHGQVIALYQLAIGLVSIALRGSFVTVNRLPIVTRRRWHAESRRLCNGAASNWRGKHEPKSRVPRLLG